MDPADRPLIQSHSWGIGNETDESSATEICNVGLISYSEWNNYKNISGGISWYTTTNLQVALGAVTNYDYNATTPVVYEIKYRGHYGVFGQGAQDITEDWQSSGLYFTVTPAAVTLSSIAITTPATKLAYTVGDTLDISGLVVTGTNSDNSTTPEAITLADVSGFNSSAAAASQTLTVTVGGKTASYTISIAAASVINVPVTGVTLNQSTLSLTVGGSNGTINASVMPANATNQVVTWSSSNPSVATVNNEVITPVAAGNAAITVTTQDGNKSATCAVTVASPITTQVVTADMNNKHLAVTASTPEGATINIPSNVTGATINVALLPAAGSTVTTDLKHSS